MIVLRNAMDTTCRGVRSKKQNSGKVCERGLNIYETISIHSWKKHEELGLKTKFGMEYFVFLTTVSCDEDLEELS